MSEPDIEVLSEREREILQLVAKGASNKEIASALYISTNTVKVHLRNIFAKIGVASRTEAAMFAVNTGLVEPAIVARREPGDVTAEADQAGQLVGETDSRREEQAGSFRERIRQPGDYLRNPRILAVILTLFVLGVLGWYGLRGSQGAQSAAGSQAVATDQVRWKERASLPTPRESLAVAAYENQIYAIGGQTRQGTSGLVERYDIDQDSWQSLASKPLAVSEAGAAVIGGRIYVPGGRQASGEISNALEIYDPLSNTWNSGSPLPEPLSAYALAVFEGKIYLFGGWDGHGALDTVLEYDPDQDVWLTDRTRMPTPRAYAGAAVAAGKIYVLGGYDGHQALAVNEVYQPDRDRAGEDPWSPAAPLPEGRYRAGVAGVADLIHLVGGESDQGPVSGVLEYFPQNDAWQQIPGLSPQAWSRMGLIPVGTHLFVLGGRLGGATSGENLSYQAIYTVLIPLIP